MIIIVSQVVASIALFMLAGWLTVVGIAMGWLMAVLSERDMEFQEWAKLILILMAACISWWGFFEVVPLSINFGFGAATT